MPSVYNIYVATSDFTVQRMVLAHGANRISALELEKEVEFTFTTSIKKTKENYYKEKNILGKSIDEDTKKRLQELLKEQID